MKMENLNWCEGTCERIKNVLLVMDEKVAKKYKINLLSRIVKRVHHFSIVNNCSECESLKENINDLILFLENQKEMDHKQYKETFKLIIKHLVKKHGLVEDGTYLSLGMAYGLIFGAALSSFFQMAIALGMGLMVGLSLDNKMKKQERVI